MTFRNFELDGERLIEPLARTEPHRCARLVTALETFMLRGEAMGTLVVEDGPVSVFLTPPREVLRGVPDAAALVLADYAERRLEIVEVVRDYGGDDRAQWDALVARARAAVVR